MGGPPEAAPANERGPRSRTTAKLKSRQILLEKRNSCYKFYSPDSGGGLPADGEKIRIALEPWVAFETGRTQPEVKGARFPYLNRP